MSDIADSWWPRNPAGYVFLGQAVDLIGCAVFPPGTPDDAGGAWLEADRFAKPAMTQQAPKPAAPPPSIARDIVGGSLSKPAEEQLLDYQRALERIEADNAAALGHNRRVAPSLARHDKVIAHIIETAEADVLKTFYLDEGGELHTIPVSAWRVQGSPDRFERYRINPANFASLPRSFDPPIFVTEGSLSQVISSLGTPSGRSQTISRKPRLDSGLRWPDVQMKQEILSWAARTGSGDSGAAWATHFRSLDHGWSNQNFRDFWPEARGTRGKPGRRGRT